MFNSLRGRLILSHILPLLVIVPLMGLALIYLLETTVLLPSLVNELRSEARLVAEVAGRESEIWQSEEAAQALLKSAGPGSAARVMLIDTQGNLIASSEEVEIVQAGHPLVLPGLERALGGETVDDVRYSSRLGEEIIDVLVPARTPSGEIRGVIRLSYHYGAVQGRFIGLRYLVTGILVLGLLGGALIGYLLALNIGTPITRVTKAVQDLAGGTRSELLPERGPREVRDLSQATNALFVRLRDLEKARQLLLANLVHELGRPLGALRSGMEALLGGALEDRALSQELLQGMNGETVRLEHLLNDLASLHGQVLGALELDVQTVALYPWLSRTLRPWQHAALKKRLYWEEIIPPDLPEVRVDPERLGQAVGNLLSNALKFTPAGGKITVSAGTEAAWVWVRVQDTGAGIPVAEQEKILEPFFRGGTGRRFPQGMGLGLSITHDLIRAHRGRLTFESEPDRGSTFTIHLPLYPGTDAQP